MPVKVLNQQALIDQRVRNTTATRAIVFAGSADQNRTADVPEKHVDMLVPMKNSQWVGSEGYHKLWNEIRTLHKRLNTAQAPADSVITDLLGKVFIDITRRAQESPDLTSLIATEETDFEFNETVNMREIYQYRGAFKEISGTNDAVPLIEQAFGETDTVDMTIRALGWKTSLKNLLYNKLHTIEKVNESVVSADVDSRNALTVGAIVNATYVASQKQAADTTSDATYDVKMYNTWRKAIKKLRALKDYRTDRRIAVPSMAILCNPSDTWSIERVIGGQLQTGGTNGTLTTQNVQSLPIAQIIEYDQGRNNGFTWGKETLDFPGVNEGTAYLFVPREYFWVLTKRPLTMETSRGSALQLSTEERAWYRVQSEFNKIFFGSSYDGTALGAGYGAIVEVTLPTDS